MRSKKFVIEHIYIDYMENPLGLDDSSPAISWKLKEEEGCRNIRQKAYRILVGSKKGFSDVWDSGVQESDCSAGVICEGIKLRAKTVYHVTVIVWDQDGAQDANQDAWFETGFLDTSQEAWGKARWIGAPEKYINARTLGVFVISCDIRFRSGSKKAGIVFGANDERLLDARKNQYEISGENYIRYVLDVSHIPADLEIYRVGYAPDDTSERPFAVVPVTAFGDTGKKPVITYGNRYETHNLKIEVTGDCAYAYVDDILVDAIAFQLPTGETMVAARPLNPLGFNDVTTFPRMCEIGYYAQAGSEVVFGDIVVNNYRAPQSEIARIKAPQVLDGVRKTFDISCHSIPMLRRDFQVSARKELEKARLYITARGCYDCRINGREVTDTWLNPGAMQYDKRIQYQTYDVTDCLQKGENGIGITLASGWWCDAQTFAVRNYNYFGEKESVLARLEITYSDGSTDAVVTDVDSWEYYGEGPYRYAGLFYGEELDGRLYGIYEDFSKPGFRIDGMRKAVEIGVCEIEASHTLRPGFGRPWPKVDHSQMKLAGGINAPVREVCVLSARSVSEPRKGLYIYDLGQEMAGVPRIRFCGKAGEVATVRYAEMLYPELPEYGSLHGLMLTDNYRDAESIDKYILRGDEGGEIFCPRFTFHGFRYIEISGVEKAPDLSDVQGIQLSSVPRITGEVGTSDRLLNRFIENIRWSMLCNFISIPTDCPQRNERMGWAGDTHVFCRTATFEADTRLFYLRYLDDFRDLQETDGRLPNIAPIGGGFGGITYESAMILIVWELYQQYGDVRIVREYYDSMKKWMAYIRGCNMPGDSFVGPLGDWLAMEETDNHLIWNAFYGYDCRLMRFFAGVLGRDEDMHYFQNLEEEAKNYWNAHFVDPETGRTRDLEGRIVDTQCSYALPLVYGMFSDENKDKAFEHLVRRTQELGCTIGTGFFGTGVLNKALSDAGRIDLAYRLLLQTDFPSWLYPVTQGATTIWERWDSYTLEKGFGGNNSMNSFNHYSLGSVLAWVYETVLGIVRDERVPGYKHFTLHPMIVRGSGLDSAEGGFETAYGRIESRWRLLDQVLEYSCSIPPNTSATLVLPGLGQVELGSGKYQYEINMHAKDACGTGGTDEENLLERDSTV